MTDTVVTALPGRPRAPHANWPMTRHPDAPADLTATGHLIGGRYFSREHEMTYVVLGSATLWECAPSGAIRLRWSNGNETVSQQDAGRDILLAPLAPDEPAAV